MGNDLIGSRPAAAVVFHRLQWKSQKEFKTRTASRDGINETAVTSLSAKKFIRTLAPTNLVGH